MKNSIVLILATVTIIISALANSDSLHFLAGQFSEDVKDPPPLQFHRECVDQMCSIVQGPGLNQCSSSADCRGPGGKAKNTHTECSGMTCKVVAGLGQSTCSSDNDCRHLECENMACVLKEGKSQNQCGVDSDCYYTACENMACIKKAGSLPDQCSTDVECSHLDCETEMCVQVSGPGANKCSTSVDCRKKIHLAYPDNSNDYLKHAEYVGAEGNCGNGEWMCEIVEFLGFNPSISLDSNNKPHISFLSISSAMPTYELRYAKFVGSGGNCYNDKWECTSIIPLSGSVHSSIALDSNDIPHIAYSAASLEFVGYAYYNGTNWVTEKVDLNYAGTDVSIALDSNDMPHISYIGINDHDLKYATKQGSGRCSSGSDNGWACTSIEPSVTGISSRAIALDLNDKPYISYSNNAPFTPTEEVLRITEKTPDNCGGGAWSCSTVDSLENGRVGYSSSIGIDSNNLPHISYYDFTNKDLKYAKNVGVGGNCGGGIWSCSVVDSQGNVGLFPSIALDSENKVYVSYYDSTNYDLKYAHFDGTNWRLQTVDYNGIIGYFYPSIAVGK